MGWQWRPDDPPIPHFGNDVQYETKEQQEKAELARLQKLYGNEEQE